MMQCDFQPRGNWWICLTCGIVVPKRGDKPPHAACAGQWIMSRTESRSIRKPPSRRERLLARYDALQWTHPHRAEIERRLDLCEACEEFADFACIRAGATCKKAENWRNKVLIGNCPRFGAAPPAV